MSAVPPEFWAFVLASALIELTPRLPGFGPRSAGRAVLHLIKKRSQIMAPLDQAMA